MGSREKFYWILFVVIGLCIGIKILSIGWFTVIIGIFVYPAILIVHTIVHVRVLGRSLEIAPKLILISHLLLLLAFLLQMDSGDSSQFVAWSNVVWWLFGLAVHPPDSMSELGWYIGWASFVIVAISWWLLLWGRSITELSPPDRPEKVRTAVILIYISIGMGVLLSILEASKYAEWTLSTWVMIYQFSGLGLVCFLTFMLGKGHNLARFTILVLFITYLPFFVLRLMQSLAATPILSLLVTAQAIIQLIALIFLFHTSSSDWFTSSSDWFREIKEKKQHTKLPAV